MIRYRNIPLSHPSPRAWYAIFIALAAVACGRQFDLGEITQTLDQDDPDTATARASLDGRVLFDSLDDIDVLVSDATVWPPAATYEILPVALGDVDGDGLGDWILGDTLFYGSARPEGAEVAVGGRARFGFDGSGDFSAAGDVNGDGLMDILFGSEQLVWVASDEREPVRRFPVQDPSARLVLGSRERLGGTVDLASVGIAFGDRDQLVERIAERLASDLPNSFARQETLLVPLGDLNADGLADFVSTTTAIYTRYLSDDGSVVVAGEEIVRESVSYIHHGSSDVAEIGAPRARLDADVRWSAAGDIDGDGQGDVIWTTPEAFYLLGGGAANGELSLAHASRVTGVVPPVLEFNDASTGALGDLDGDGFDDFALNAAMEVRSPTDVSTPWCLFYGGPQLLSGSDVAARASATFETSLYSSLAALGDWDDDGRSDLVLRESLWQPGEVPEGDPPSAQKAILLRGGEQRFSGSYVVPQFDDNLATDPAPSSLIPVAAGDLDGDGFADMFVKGIYSDDVLDLGIIYGAPLPLPTVY